MIDPAGKLLVFENFAAMDIVMRPASTFFVSNNGPRQPWFVRLFWWFALLGKRPKPQQSGRISIEQFFTSVHNSARELDLVRNRAAGYEQAMLRAKQAGQQALLEQLKAGMNAYKMETQLLALGLPRFLEEQDLVKFYKQSKKGLRLDWVKNFVRQVPQEVLAKKIRADEIGIFDNYAVLHYDPQVKSYAETEEEKVRRKDPILFGLMSGRRRLYMVGDWKDEYCDLTLDQVADALGEGSVKDLGTDTIESVMEP
jgi:hypothetical protein